MTTTRASLIELACSVMMTAMATVMGAVGPEIWERVPPNSAANSPTPIAP